MRSKPAASPDAARPPRPSPGVTLALAGLLATAALADPPGAASLGQGADAGPGAAASAQASDQGAPAGLTEAGTPRFYYQLVEGSAGDWVQGAPHFHPLLDTPAFGNQTTELFPQGVCHGLGEIVTRWYWDIVHPNQSLGRPRGPGEAITSPLAYNRERQRPWHVYSANLPHFRLRAYTQPRSSAYPFADRDAVLDRAGGAQYLQGIGEGETANLMGGDPNGYPAPRLAQMLVRTLTNGPIDDGPYSSGRRGQLGFATFGLTIRRFTPLEPDADEPRIDPSSPAHAGRHAILLYAFCRARVRAVSSDLDAPYDAEAPTHDALVFRFYDPNLPDRPLDPDGLTEDSPLPQEAEEQLLFYIEDLQAFSFSEPYQYRVRTADPRVVRAVQADHVITDPLSFDDFGRTVGSGRNPVEAAIYETRATYQTREDPSAHSWR